MKREKDASRTDTDIHGQTQTKLIVPVSDGPCRSVYSSAELAANAALSLLNLACYLLDRQISRLAEDFEKNGGFTEKLYRIRSAKNKRNT